MAPGGVHISSHDDHLNPYVETSPENCSVTTILPLIVVGGVLAFLQIQAGVGDRLDVGVGDGTKLGVGVGD